MFLMQLAKTLVWFVAKTVRLYISHTIQQQDAHNSKIPMLKYFYF